MNKVLKNLMIILLILFSFNLAYAEFSNVCCYDPDYGFIQTWNTDKCSGEDEVAIPMEPDNIECVYQRKGCVIDSKCYATINGDKIYDLDEVKNYFNSEYGISVNSYCDSLKNFDNSCTGDYKDSGNVGGGDNKGGGGSSSSGNSSNIGDYNINGTNINATADMAFCNDAGGPFGFFVTKESCESIGSGDIKPCIYNPYLSGYVGMLSGDIEELQPMEGACVAKSLIQTCYDYKTQENCEENPVYNDERYTKENLQSCKWVPTSNFYTGFSVDSGICIADVVDPSKHFNIKGYANRGNLLADPSFENGGGAWTGNFNLRQNIIETYDGLSNIEITAGNSIEQEVGFIDPSVSYSMLVHVEGKTFTAGKSIIAEITEYDNSGTELGNTKYPFSLSQLSDSQVFQRVNFQQGGHKLDSKTRKLKFKITAEDDVVIDAVHLGKTNEHQLVIDYDVFNPLTIIHSSASICNECFSDLNMNFCTLEKSNTLGDCSYMVSSPGKEYSTELPNYLGKSDNLHLAEPWKSQSIAGSKVFCEMYLAEEVCTDSSNYVNSKYRYLHTLSGNNLCKWSPEYGCYKDSDNSGGPDLQDNTPFLSFMDLSASGYSYGHFADFVIDGDPSDFALSCDSIPPNSYIFFEAKNTNRESLVVTGDVSELIGAVNINLEAYDILQEACEPYSISKKIFIDYIINENIAHYRLSETAAINDYYNVKEYFVNANNKMILKDGQNNIKIIVKDQSGNIGKIREFNLNMDLSGPNITLFKPDLSSNPYIGPGTIFELIITDTSKVDSCSFTLDPAFSVNGDYYESEGNLSEYSYVDGDVYEFAVPIYNSSDNGDLYQLTITCEDIFGQATIEEFHLVADFDTSLVLKTPLGFLNENLDFGYLNGETDVHAISSDKKLTSCNFDWKGTDGSGNLNINTITDGFSDARYSGVKFYANITGKIRFASDGKKEIAIKCTDDIGNTHIENIVYYYDTQSPEILDYELIGVEIGGKRNVVGAGGEYYARQTGLNNYLLDVILNVTIDGKGSWISDDIELSYFDKVNMSDIKLLVDVITDLDNSSFIGNLYVGNFANLLIYVGEQTGEENLYLLKYKLDFSDKAGNHEVGPIQFYYDGSEPKFKFGGEVYFGMGTQLYTKTNDPQFDITFNSPSYRKFNCSVDLLWGFVNYKKKFDATSNLKFKLSEIVDTFVLDEKKSSGSFSITCTDQYGVVLSNNYKLTYDNKKPILDDMYLDQYNENVYLINEEGVEINSVLTDKLVFEFLNTGEAKYTCEYEFSSNDYYCREETFKQDFIANGGLKYKTSDIKMLSDSALDSICYRKEGFDNKLKQYRENNNEILKTKITIKGKCYDAVMFETDSIEKEVAINYVSGTRFADFEFDYNQDEVTFIVKSLVPFTQVTVATDFEGNDEIMNLGTHVDFKGGVYIYKGTWPLPVDYEEGFYTFWALGKDAEGNIWDRINGQMIIDRTPPELELLFPDLSDEGFIHSEEFEILFNAKDKPVNFGELDEISLSVNGKEIYNTKKALYDLTTMMEIDLSRNYFTSSNIRYFGDIIFTGAQFNQKYDFKLVAIDKHGNIKEMSKSINVKDGVSIRLFDTENAIVDYGGFSYITKNAAPKIKFKTSKTVDKCSVYPYVDKHWLNITENPEIANELAFLNKGDVTDNTYNFDLSSFGLFDLDMVESKSSFVKIVCIFNETPYSYSRKISMIDSIPDYVLSSSEGFVLNEEPYETIISVKSVGSYRYITCSYGLSGQAKKEFENKNDVSFESTLSFRDKSGGEYTLELNCVDKLGTKGPDKKYKFTINKGLGVVLDDVKIINSNLREYNPGTDNIFYVDKLSGLGLKFTANKKNLACNYEVSKAGGVISKVISFFKNLFVDNSLVIDAKENPYEYVDKGKISIENSGVYNMYVECRDSSGNEMRKDYKLQYKEASAIDFDLVLQ